MIAVPCRRPTLRALAVALALMAVVGLRLPLPSANAETGSPKPTVGLVGSFPGSRLPVALRLRPFPRPQGGPGFDGYIDSDLFHDVFAGDVPAATAAVMAASQRPATVETGIQPTHDPAWKTIPSWFLVARNDHTIPPDAERFMAKRAGSHVVEIDSSHVAMISNPDVAAELIRAAAATIH